MKPILTALFCFHLLLNYWCCLLGLAEHDFLLSFFCMNKLLMTVQNSIFLLTLDFVNYLSNSGKRCVPVVCVQVG